MRLLALSVLAVATAGCSTLASVHTAASSPEVGAVESATAPPSDEPATVSLDGAMTATGVGETGNVASTTAAVEGQTDTGVRLDQPLQVVMIADIDPGFLHSDGVELEYPASAMRWRTTTAFDPSTGYSYVAVDGVAEPGDAGCWELLVPSTDAVTLLRSTEERATAFSPADDLISIDDDAEYRGPLTILTVADLGDQIGGLDAAVADPEIAGGWRIELDGPTVMRLIDLLSAAGGDSPSLDGGTLRYRADEAGRLVHYDVRAEGLDPRVGDRDPRHRSLSLDVDLDRSGVAPTPVTPETTRATAGGCEDHTLGVIGDWRLATGSWGGSSEPDLTAIEDTATRLTIKADGSFSGSTDCRTFSGQGTFDYAWLREVTLEVNGEPCQDAMAALRDDALVSLLESDPEFLVFTDGIALFSDTGMSTFVAVT